MLKPVKLPDRTPIKLALTITPDLARALGDYTASYNHHEDKAETADLIPAMLLVTACSPKRGGMRRALCRGDAQPSVIATKELRRQSYKPSFTAVSLMCLVLGASPSVAL